jgi:hypothetical protein
MAYISKGQGYTYGVKTLAQISALTGMSAGDTAFASDISRIMTYDGTFWMCDDFIVIVNRSGATLNQWDVVIAQQGGTASEIACTTTTTAGNALVVGVVVYSAANGANTVVAIKGNYPVNVQGTVATGDDLTTSTTARRAQTNIGLFSEGVFAFARSANPSGAGTVNCVLTARKELN